MQGIGAFLKSKQVADAEADAVEKWLEEGVLPGIQVNLDNVVSALAAIVGSEYEGAQNDINALAAASVVQARESETVVEDKRRDVWAPVHALFNMNDMGAGAASGIELGVQCLESQYGIFLQNRAPASTLDQAIEDYLYYALTAYFEFQHRLQYQSRVSPEDTEKALQSILTFWMHAFMDEAETLRIQNDTPVRDFYHSLHRKLLEGITRPAVMHQIQSILASGDDRTRAMGEQFADSLRRTCAHILLYVDFLQLDPPDIDTESPLMFEGRAAPVHMIHTNELLTEEEADVHRPVPSTMFSYVPEWNHPIRLSCGEVTQDFRRKVRFNCTTVHSNKNNTEQYAIGRTTIPLQQLRNDHPFQEVCDGVQGYQRGLSDSIHRSLELLNRSEQFASQPDLPLTTFYSEQLSELFGVNNVVNCLVCTKEECERLDLMEYKHTYPLQVGESRIDTRVYTVYNFLMHLGVIPYDRQLDDVFIVLIQRPDDRSDVSAVSIPPSITLNPATAV